MAFVAEVTLRRVGWIEVVGERIDVRENRLGSKPPNRTRGREEGKARENHFVPGANFQRHQGEQQGIAP